MLGNKNIPETDDWVPLILIIGQSNAAGQGEYTRAIGNTDYGYKGIRNYPSIHTTEDYYTSTGDWAHIYYKGDQRSANFALDNGEWQVYNPETNSITDRDATTRTKEIGSEFSLAHAIHDATGKEVFIIKGGLGGTALCPFGATTNGAGYWNYTLRTNTEKFFIQRAKRDFAEYKPGKQLRCVAIVWWQGETDAQNGISKSTYKYEWSSLKNYIDNAVKSNFVLTHPPVWNVVKLKYTDGAAQDVINSALTEVVSEHTNCHLIDATPYPRRNELTSDEATPLTLGAPTNADGGTDSTNSHNSYISQLAIGELAFLNIQPFL